MKILIGIAAVIIALGTVTIVSADPDPRIKGLKGVVRELVHVTEELVTSIDELRIAVNEANEAATEARIAAEEAREAVEALMTTPTPEPTPEPIPCLGFSECTVLTIDGPTNGVGGFVVRVPLGEDYIVPDGTGLGINSDFDSVHVFGHQIAAFGGGISPTSSEVTLVTIVPVLPVEIIEVVDTSGSLDNDISGDVVVTDYP